MLILIIRLEIQFHTEPIYLNFLMIKSIPLVIDPSNLIGEFKLIKPNPTHQLVSQQGFRRHRPHFFGWGVLVHLLKMVDWLVRLWKHKQIIFIFNKKINLYYFYNLFFLWKTNLIGFSPFVYCVSVHEYPYGIQPYGIS